MITEKTNILLSEILNSQGFINIDQNDIDNFKANIEEIDAEKVSGKNEDVDIMLDDAITTIKKRHGHEQMIKMLFVIRLSQENSLMEHISSVYDVIDKQSEDLECQWGLSTMEHLRGDHLELIVVIGFKNDK